MSKLNKLVVKTGNVVTPLGNLIKLEDSPSINDSGFVGFVGRGSDGTDLLVANDSGKITNLSVALPVNFSKAVQINNQNQVVARDSLNGASAIRAWDLNNPGSFKVFATGNYPADF